jgi:hypothetical protein
VEVGGREEVLTTIQAAVQVYRRLAGADPATYELDLAMSLNQPSVRDDGGRKDRPSRRSFCGSTGFVSCDRVGW